MNTAEVMYADRIELNRRALVADLGATLGEQPEFRRHAELVSTRMPEGLAHAIHHRGWIVEPHGDDVALAIARHYGHGRRRQRIIAVFLREAAAALRFVPPDVTDPHAWSELMLMNVGAIAHTPQGQAAGLTRRPSPGVLDRRERGCLGIARRGAGRCVVCGTPVDRAPVAGAVVDRDHQPYSCSALCTEDERYYTDAMSRVFDRCEWLLAEAIPLRTEVLPIRW